MTTPQPDNTCYLSPQEHHDEAARLLIRAANPDTGAEASAWQQRQAQVHATLALAGFTRDLPAAIDYDVRLRGAGY
jgi:hypothetical protein